MHADDVKAPLGWDETASDIMAGPNEGETVLQEANRLVNGDRRKDYGHPSIHFKRTIGMLNAMFADYLTKPLEPQHWAQIILCDKISRAMETPSKRDHWVDLAGYAQCGYLAVESETNET